MRFSILTLFPGMFEGMLGESILGRAREQGLLDARLVNIREYSANKHRNADDYPFGGGAGMVMLAQPIVDAMQAATRDLPAHRVLMTPRGTPFTQAHAERFAGMAHVALLCGHYEGVDQRVSELCIDEEISIGDYVLTGGELAAMVVLDATARLVPGVLGSEASAGEESFTSGLLEYPQYTRPREFQGLAAPEILLSGNHAKIMEWRMLESLRITRARRPEMIPGWLAEAKLSRRQRKMVQDLLDALEAGRENGPLTQ